MTLTLTNPYKKEITSKNQSTQTQISLSIKTKILLSQKWKLVQSTGPNKSTTTLLTALTEVACWVVMKQTEAKHAQLKSNPALRT